MCLKKLTSIFVYDTFKHIENRTNIQALAKQMSNSAVMIERRNAILTATMAAKRLAL